jgi:hypothetical protein
MIVSYQAISLVYVSIIMLSLSVSYAGNLDTYAKFVQFMIVSLYVTMALLMIVFAPLFIRRRIVALRSTESKTYYIPAILSGGPGLGIIMANLLKNSPYLNILLTALASPLALILCTIGVLGLYQAIVLGWNFDKAA